MGETELQDKKILKVSGRSGDPMWLRALVALVPVLTASVPAWLAYNSMQHELDAYERLGMPLTVEAQQNKLGQYSSLGKPDELDRELKTLGEFRTAGETPQKTALGLSLLEEFKRLGTVEELNAELLRLQQYKQVGKVEDFRQDKNDIEGLRKKVMELEKKADVGFRPPFIKDYKLELPALVVRAETVTPGEPNDRKQLASDFRMSLLREPRTLVSDLLDLYEPTANVLDLFVGCGLKPPEKLKSAQVVVCDANAASGSAQLATWEYILGEFLDAYGEKYHSADPNMVQILGAMEPPALLASESEFELAVCKCLRSFKEGKGFTESIPSGDRPVLATKKTWSIAGSVCQSKKMLNTESEFWDKKYSAPNSERILHIYDEHENEMAQQVYRYCVDSYIAWKVSSAQQRVVLVRGSDVNGTLGNNMFNVLGTSLRQVSAVEKRLHLFYGISENFSGLGFNLREANGNTGGSGISERVFRNALVKQYFMKGREMSLDGRQCRKSRTLGSEELATVPLDSLFPGLRQEVEEIRAGRENQ